MLAELDRSHRRARRVDHRGARQAARRRRREVAYSAEFFRWNAEETVRIHGTLGCAPSGANRIIVHHPPVGVVVIVTPWNFPAAMITRKLAPALAAGNAVVIKPPARHAADRAADRRTAARGRACPTGVVNIVPTTTSGDWFDAAVDHPADADGVVHRLDRGRHRRCCKRAADRVLKTRDGARRQRAVRRVRRRRHRRRRRGGDGRQDAPLRRDVHRRQPVLRARRAWPTSSPPKFAAAMGASGSATASTTGVTCGPMINAEGDRHDRRAGQRRRRRRCDGDRSAGTAAGRRVLLRADGARQRRAGRGDHRARDLRAGRADHHLRRHRRDDRARRTTPRWA